VMGWKAVVTVMPVFPESERVCGRCLNNCAARGRRYCSGCESKIRCEMEESGYLSGVGGVGVDAVESRVGDEVRADGTVRAAER